MSEGIEDEQLNEVNSEDQAMPPNAGDGFDGNPEKTGLQVAVVVAVVILVLFGLYWGGKILLLPSDEPGDAVPGEGAEVSIDTECDNPTVYTSVNSALGNAKNVCKMDLSGQGLTSLSIYIGYFTNLVELDISDNNISWLPSEIGWLRKLQRFDASNNDLPKLTLEIGWLRELREWDLSNNQLQWLPAEIGWLTKMENLNLANNQLTRVPLHLGWMTNMKTLNLSGNPSEVKASASRIKVWMPRANIILP